MYPIQSIHIMPTEQSNGHLDNNEMQNNKMTQEQHLYKQHDRNINGSIHSDSDRKLIVPTDEDDTALSSVVTQSTSTIIRTNNIEIDQNGINVPKSSASDVLDV